MSIARMSFNRHEMVTMSEPVLLLSNEGMGAKLGEGTFDQVSFDQMR